jgi:hypothetical protein
MVLMAVLDTVIRAISCWIWTEIHHTMSKVSFGLYARPFIFFFQTASSFTKTRLISVSDDVKNITNAYNIQQECQDELFCGMPFYTGKERLYIN